MEEYSRMRKAHEEALMLSGENFEIRRENGIVKVKGIRISSKYQIQFFPEVDVQIGETVVSVQSGTTYHIIDLDHAVIEGKVLLTKAIYETALQRRNRMEDQKPNSTSYSFSGDVYGSIIGSQENANLSTSFDFRKIELEIEQKGGKDAEELKAMIAEIQQSLIASETLSRGSLSKFSGLMEKHSWITGSIAQALLGWAISASVSG